MTMYSTPIRNYVLAVPIILVSWFVLDTDDLPQQLETGIEHIPSIPTVGTPVWLNELWWDVTWIMWHYNRENLPVVHIEVKRSEYIHPVLNATEQVEEEA